MTASHFKLLPNQDGTYDLVIQYDKLDAEFALDFLSRERIQTRTESLSDFVEKNAKNLKISAVRFMVAGVILASTPFAFFNALATGPEDVFRPGQQ